MHSSRPQNETHGACTIHGRVDSLLVRVYVANRQITHAQTGMRGFRGRPSATEEGEGENEGLVSGIGVAGRRCVCIGSLVTWVHVTVACLHATAVGLLVWALLHRDHFIALGRIPLVCLRVNTTIPLEEAKALRAMAPVVAENGCFAYDLLAVCTALHAATCVAHCFYAWIGGSAGWRWAEYTWSAPVVFLHLAITSGTREVNTLILVAAVSVAVMPYGYLFEQKSKAEAFSMRNLLTLQAPGCLAVAGIFAVVLWAFILAMKDAPVDVPDGVTWIVGAELVLLPAFAVVNLVHGAERVSATTADIAYAVLSFSSKIVPTAIFVMSIWIA